MTGTGWTTAYDYWLDACQRSVLLFDMLRERGNQYLARNEKLAPNVLIFKPEVILDGRTLARPVNYVLVRILPPVGLQADRTNPPFIVIDPRRARAGDRRHEAG